MHTAECVCVCVCKSVLRIHLDNCMFKGLNVEWILMLILKVNNETWHASLALCLTVSIRRMTSSYAHTHTNNAHKGNTIKCQHH